MRQARRVPETRRPRIRVPVGSVSVVASCGLSLLGCAASTRRRSGSLSVVASVHTPRFEDADNLANQDGFGPRDGAATVVGQVGMKDRENREALAARSGPPLDRTPTPRSKTFENTLDDPVTALGVLQEVLTRRARRALPGFRGLAHAQHPSHLAAGDSD